MKIASTVGLIAPQRALVEKAVPGAEIVDRQCRTIEEMAEVVGSANGCDVLFTFRVPPETMRIAPRLKWIQLLSAGADHALKGQVGAGRLAMTTSSGIHAATMAEYTIASMLAFAHKLHLLIRAQMNREWRRSGDFMSMVDAMRGHHAGRDRLRLDRSRDGAAGAGARDAGDRARSAIRRCATTKDGCRRGSAIPTAASPSRFFGPGERVEMLAECDYVTVTLPLTEATRGFIGERELGAMKPHAYLVNVGRGEVVDQGRWSRRCARAVSAAPVSTSSNASRWRRTVRCGRWKTRS